jgi:hypothetical protein
LVEHLVYTERVGGSSPSPPTNRPRGSWSFLPSSGVARAFIVLACVAGAAFAGAARAAQAPMTFRAVSLDSPGCGSRCPEVVVAEGVIENDTAQTFIDFARQASLSARLRSVIFIDSPGGNVVASMELGAAFRKLSSAVIVAGYASQGGRSGPVSGQCLSACVYALMGASRRVVPNVSRVGLHRMSIVEAGSGPVASRRMLADPHLVAVLARYAARMGVDPALVWRAESLTPGTLHVLTAGEMARWRLASPRL